MRVKVGAFGTGRPRRDLVLSPDHAVHGSALADGPAVLVPVRYLVNGATIVQEAADAISYFHVELDRHDVLLAEGLPTESYLDTANRSGPQHKAIYVQSNDRLGEHSVAIPIRVVVNANGNEL